MTRQTVEQQRDFIYIQIQQLDTLINILRTLRDFNASPTALNAIQNNIQIPVATNIFTFFNNNHPQQQQQGGGTNISVFTWAIDTLKSMRDVFYQNYLDLSVPATAGDHFMLRF